MRLVSDRMREAIRGTNWWHSTCEWTNDGGATWSSPVGLLGGTTTEDLTSQVHWQARGLTLNAPKGWDGVNSINTQLRLKQGIRWRPGDEEMIDLGTYRVQNVKDSITEPGALTVDADSFEDYSIRGTAVSPKTILSGSAESQLRQLLSLVFRTPAISWDPSVAKSKVLPALTVERDVWSLITHVGDASSITNALGALIFPDGRNVWRIVQTPSLEDDVAWSISTEDMLFDGDELLDNDSVRNQVVVTGTGSTLVGPVVVSDNDPTSPTYFRRAIEDGGCGPRPEYYESELITDEAQARTVGKSRLARLLGLRQLIGITSHYDPTKEAGDVGEAVTPDGRRLRVLLDSVTYSFEPTPGPLQCQTRTTATRLAGDDNYELLQEGSD